ncbi:MAG: S9 family peptidase [Bacteroidales bacterium]|nr:S9 family peptidase [Bacteroidales bacterium]
MLTACNQLQKFEPIAIDYPETDKDTVTDNFFGVNVADPYRWLEDDNSEKTLEWVKAQNEVTFGYLKQIPFRETIRARLDTIANFQRYQVPFKKNNKIYYFKNTGLQNQSVLYETESISEEGKVFLDPNTFSADGTTSIGSLAFSEDGDYLAYTISEGGSDWQKIVVMETADKKPLNDTINDVKFTSIAWDKNMGFYYSRYEKPGEGTVLSGITRHHKVYYHKLGTPQSDDYIVFGEGPIKRRYIGAQIFKNSNFIFINAAEGTSGNELYYADKNSAKPVFKPIVTGFENDHTVLFARDKEIYLFTNLNAPNKRIVKVMLDNPAPGNWIDIVPERPETMESANITGGNIFAHYLKDACSMVEQYNLSGQKIRQVELPGIGSVSGFDGEENDIVTFFGFESFTVPFTTYAFELESGKTTLVHEPKLVADINGFETRQVFYSSKDGTKVPMFIIMRKGTKLNGKNPVLLYGYGGFNISLSPYFSTRWLAWLDMGGIFALANIRGGGEYGEAWHEAGTKLKKQNVFDDFIAAAEYLTANKYTSPEKLAIMGGSNGGLLVGAVMAQRPELFRVALPAVGVLDMLRFHKFTAGAGWITDYGCADSSKTMFGYLYAYSPVHNLKPGTSYPATLVTTADHDDRVVPAHSFKFAATLQANQAGELPVLIRIDTKAGHGAGKSTTMFLDELADIYSFAFYNMNQQPAYFTK